MMTKNDKQPSALPRQALQAEVVSQSFDEKQGTVDVVWSTGARVRFWDWDIGDYDLTLGLDAENVDLTFARLGAPVLNAHQSWGVEGVVGVIDQIDVDGKRGTARLRFSKRADVAAIRQDVADGILRFVSVGTRLRLLRDITEENDPCPHYFAALHEPLEISLAPIPRDRGAVMQAEKGEERFPVQVVTQSAQAARGEGSQMDPEKKTGAAAVAAEPVPSPTVTQTEGQNPAPTAAPAVATASSPAPKETAVDQEAIKKQAADAERTRCLEIRTVVKQSKLSGGDELAEGWIKQGTTIDEVRRLVLDKLAEQSDATASRSGVSVVTDETDTIRQSVSSAILHRWRPAEHKLELRANEFVGMSLLEIGRELLVRQGHNPRGWTRLKIAEQALHATSDFPLILENIAGKTLRKAYENTPRTFVPWCREATLPDFKQVSRTQLGEAPALLVVTENGEFKRGTMGELAEKYALATYGRVIGFSRQAMINDDLNAFARIIEAFGMQAANLQSDIVYAILTANGNMSDGVALFASGHNNVSGGAAVISIASLGLMRATMRKQKGLDGTTIINVDPKFLIVPAAIETTAQQFLAQVQPEQAANHNPFAGSMQAIVEPRLDASSASVWYGAANPMQVDTIEYGFLEGQSGPFTESRIGFDVDGVEFKCRLDFAAKAIDWRGLYRNAA